MVLVDDFTRLTRSSLYSLIDHADGHSVHLSLKIINLLCFITSSQLVLSSVVQWRDRPLSCLAPSRGLCPQTQRRVGKIWPVVMTGPFPVHPRDCSFQLLPEVEDLRGLGGGSVASAFSAGECRTPTAPHARYELL